MNTEGLMAARQAAGYAFLQPGQRCTHCPGSTFFLQTSTGDAMTLRSTLLAAAAAALLSSAAFAQTAANADAPALTKEQIRAQMKADHAANVALAKKVRQAIYSTKALNDTDIAVFAKARTGKVVLAGTILDESQDQIAQDTASKVAGVQTVASKLMTYEAP
ncbi:BON domain-containing protein [Paraburkholderia tropica]|uniref:BON domain-containing protein n=1 Tax=Paraburkholderia tropica TaxID=92647 RepID=UPI002AB0FC5C|nr:BON domain-containing protein [Paraburkholderia tropica]